MTEHGSPVGETWRPIPSRPGYEASDLGRVRSVDRVVVQKNGRAMRLKGRMIRPHTMSSGYEHIITGSRYPHSYVHRLVLEAFVGPCPPGMEACHWNGIPGDNRLHNLRWDTPSANNADILRLGRHYETKKTHCPQGHRLVQPNLVRAELPSRKCKACNRGRACMQRLELRGETGDLRSICDQYYADIMNEVAP